MNEKLIGLNSVLKPSVHHPKYGCRRASTLTPKCPRPFKSFLEFAQN